MHFSPDIHFEETAANAQNSAIVRSNKTTEQEQENARSDQSTTYTLSLLDQGVNNEDSDVDSVDDIISYLANTPTALLSYALSNDVDFEKLALLTKIATDDCPTYAEAMAGPYSQELKIAIAQEYRSLNENSVFSAYFLK
jgi:hypothetical protein